jgi:hypothetical protein
MMALSTSVLKNRFLPRCAFTISSRPGSKIGRSSLFHAAILTGLTSTMVTVLLSRLSDQLGSFALRSGNPYMSGHIFAMTEQVGPPT